MASYADLSASSSLTITALAPECSRTLNPMNPEINLTVYDPVFNIFTILQIAALFFYIFPVICMIS